MTYAEETKWLASVNGTASDAYRQSDDDDAVTVTALGRRREERFRRPVDQARHARASEEAVIAACVYIRSLRDRPSQPPRMPTAS